MSPSSVVVGAMWGTTARPHCSAAPEATRSQRSLREPSSAGRAAASVRKRHHRPDLRYAELGRLLDHELHAVALQGRHRQGESQWRLGPRQDGVQQPRGHAASRDLFQDAVPLVAGPVEDPSRRTGAQPQHVARVVRGVIGQRHPRPRGGRGHVEAVQAQRGAPGRGEPKASGASNTSAAHSPWVRSRGVPQAA